MVGCNELAGYVKTCMHTHTKACKCEIWNLIRAYLSDCLTTGNHYPVNFAIKVYIGLRLARLKELQSRYFSLAHTCRECFDFFFVVGQIRVKTGLHHKHVLP